jgi:DNA-binding MarR family transcriptional regulator
VYLHVKLARRQIAASAPNLVGTGYCACFNLRKAARAITQLYDAGLQSSGIRSTQFTILVAVAKSERISIGDLAAMLVTDRTTLTRNLGQMQKQGLLDISERSIMRQRFVTLSHKGAQVLRRSLPLWREIQRRFIRRIGRTDWTTLQQELERLSADARTLGRKIRASRMG